MDRVDRRTIVPVLLLLVEHFPVLVESREDLLVRHFGHFLGDRLTFDLQPEIATLLGYRDRAGARGVERFMKHYYLIAKEIGDLTRNDRIVLMDEMEKVSNAIRVLYNPIKVNVGALGNVVRQLHIHIVGRTECDPAWPGPVWGHSAAEAYAPEAIAMRVREVRRKLGFSSA